MAGDVHSGTLNGRAGWDPSLCWDEDTNELSQAATVYNWTMIAFALLVVTIGM